ncbi:MAG: hypothetical protein M9948_09725 [Lentimicrobium sp.]|nr:hypothetical protein [Lentimicrobium sp.]
MKVKRNWNTCCRCMSVLRHLLKYLFVFILYIFFVSVPAFNQVADTTTKVVSVNGYVKELPYLQFVNNKTTTFNNILNLRLNFAVNISNSTNIHLEMRNRLMFGDTEWGTGQILKSLQQNNGWINLGAAAPVGGSRAVIHTMADRLFFEHNAGKWQIRAGRQRINWGINLVSNPNDLFNTYSFFDFDYPERPGADALRIQYYRSTMSHVEMAFAPADHIKDAVGAFLYAINRNGFDIQFITGYYHNRLSLGMGWAGNILNAGFKGEIGTFTDIEKTGRKTNVIVSLSGDYMFEVGLYMVVEALYNGGFESGEYAAIDLYRPLSADNIMFSEYALTTSVSYPFSPLLNGTLSVMSLPDIHAFFISPSLTWSLLPDVDAALTSQIFSVGGRSGESVTATALIGSLQWSF